ncbi:MAG: DUF1566 domain-containing protein [Gammaproteobacteria bacterium]|nr:DUF1566 domain-containing protein [Gammaproteobacteria bacterium]
MTTKKINIMLLSIIVIFSGQLQAACNTSDFTESTPTSSFTTNGDGTATDLQTGLMWMRCAIGQTWDVGLTDCSTGSPIGYDWEEAHDEAEASIFATYTDWRLPNIKELSSIVEVACNTPALNEDIFLNLSGSSTYGTWRSSTFNHLDPGSQLVINIQAGIITAIDTDENGFVRLVRGGDL